MKKLVLIVFLFSILFSQSEKEWFDPEIYNKELKPNWNTSFERFEYSEVIEVPELKKDDIYNRLVRWATLTYPTVSNVIELKDLDSGNIIIRASVSNEIIGVESKFMRKKFSQIYQFEFPFILDIRIKDGKYKYELFVSSMSLKVVNSMSSAGGDKYIKIENFHHNKYYTTDFFNNISLYSIVDDKIEVLLQYMQLFVLGESLEEDW